MYPTAYEKALEYKNKMVADGYSIEYITAVLYAKFGGELGIYTITGMVENSL